MRLTLKIKQNAIARIKAKYDAVLRDLHTDMQQVLHRISRQQLPAPLCDWTYLNLFRVCGTQNLLSINFPWRSDVCESLVVFSGTTSHSITNDTEWRELWAQYTDVVRAQNKAAAATAKALSLCGTLNVLRKQFPELAELVESDHSVIHKAHDMDAIREELKKIPQGDFTLNKI